MALPTEYSHVIEFDHIGIDQYFAQPFFSMLLDAMREPKLHTINYRANPDSRRCVYTPPQDFYWSNAPTSPSDCTWIIPNTGDII